MATPPKKISAGERAVTKYAVPKSGNRDVEREQQNRINKDLKSRVDEVLAQVAAIGGGNNGGGNGDDFSLSVDQSNLSLTNTSGNNYYLDVKAGGIGSNELASTAVTAGSYGDDDSVPSYTVDEDGRLTAAADVQLPFVVYLTTGTGGLAARDMVAVNSSGEAVKAQANSCDTKAIGYVKSAFLATETAKVYLLKGTLTGFTGLTILGQYYLSAATAGGITLTPDFTADYVLQYIGTAYSTTALEVNMGPGREVGL